MYVFTPNSIILSSQINYNFDELFNGRNTCPHRVEAFLSASQTGIADGIWSTIVFNALRKANDDFDIGFGIYTVPVTGYYQINFTARLIGTGLTQSYTRINVNTANTYLENYNPETSGAASANSNGLVYLTAGDTVAFQVFANVTAGNTATAYSAGTYGYTFASIHLVGV